MRRFHRLTIALLLVACVAFAYDFSALKPQGHVSDFAGVIDAQTRAGLNRYCKAVETSTGAEIAIVTLDTLNGEPVEDVANHRLSRSATSLCDRASICRVEIRSMS